MGCTGTPDVEPNRGGQTNKHGHMSMSIYIYVFYIYIYIRRHTITHTQTHAYTYIYIYIYRYRYIYTHNYIYIHRLEGHVLLERVPVCWCGFKSTRGFFVARDPKLRSESLGAQDRFAMGSLGERLCNLAMGQNPNRLAPSEHLIQSNH